MARLPRPYIPIVVRLDVAHRQMCDFVAKEGRVGYFVHGRGKQKLAIMLAMLFNGAPCELHHRPALLNRRRKRNGDYDPPANDPDYLVYLPADEHDIETRVRGLRGQHSDLALARKRKRAERKGRPKAKIRSRGFRKVVKQRRRQFPLPPRRSP